MGGPLLSARRRRGRAGALVLLLGLAPACGSSERAWRAPSPARSVVPVELGPKEHVQYVLARAGLGSSATRVALPGGGTGYVQGATRFTVGVGGKVTGTAPRTENIVRGEAIPPWLGGGFLFHGSDALFRSDEFLGELHSIASSASGFSSVTMGTTSMLVVTGDGVRFTLEPTTGKRGGVSPVGASAFGAVSASRGITLADGGFAYLTSDGGKSWARLDARAPTGIVVEDADLAANRPRALFVVERGGGALRVDASRAERASVGPASKPTEQPTSSSGQPFLDLALKVGAPLDDPDAPTEAVVADGGSLTTVSLETGEVLATEPGAIPPDLPCQAERLSNEILFLCRQSSRAVVASRPLLGGKVTLEASFRSPGVFVRGGGDAVLFTGPCHGESTKPGKACLRVPRSDAVEAAMWSDLDRSAEISDADPNKPVSVVTWVPTDKGAIAVLGGDEGGLLDTRAHTRTRLSEEDSRKLAQVFQPTGAELVERRFRVLDDGTIEGWSASGAGVRVSDGGKTVSTSAFAFSGARFAGPRGLALSPTGALWQSTDWGQTFVEVASPSAVGAAPSPRECSAVGCNLGEWLRVGWEARPPVPPTKPSPPSLRVVPVESPPDLPRLSCVASGALVRKALAASASGRFGFGATAFPASAHGPILRATFARAVPGGWTAFEAPSLRALLRGKQPDVGADGAVRLDGPGTERQIAWIEPFDPKAAEKHASIQLDALVAAVTAQGGTPPELTNDEEVGTAVPVLADGGGLLLSGIGGPPLWLRDRRVVPLSFGADGASIAIASAIETKPDELTVLALDDDGTAHARRLGRGATEEVFAIPAPVSTALPQSPDALALGPGGSLAVVRIPSATPPTKESPAYLLRPGQEPIALAPWATVQPADSAPCADGKGYRAIVTSRRSWLATEAGQAEEDHLFLARVRWSEERVCLEAVEAGAIAHDLPTGSADSYFVARFGKDAGAGHVLVASGAELREPRACTLHTPTP